jgi:hypothetical protein
LRIGWRTIAADDSRRTTRILKSTTRLISLSQYHELALLKEKLDRLSALKNGLYA